MRERLAHDPQNDVRGLPPPSAESYAFPSALINYLRLRLGTSRGIASYLGKVLPGEAKPHRTVERHSRKPCRETIA